MTTVEIDGVLYEKNEGSDGVITFTPAQQQKMHTFEFTKRELNVLANLLYIHTQFEPTWEDYDNGGTHRFSESAEGIMEDIYQALYAYSDANMPDDSLAGVQSDYDKMEWKNCEE